jgi:hypothetical protein
MDDEGMMPPTTIGAGDESSPTLRRVRRPIKRDPKLYELTDWL